MSAFDRLHPAIQHHIVNSLGWKSLRPLQEQAIEPLLAGEHALLIAPTAGGKTEAAFFPVLSRMLEEDWRGLTLIYVCPLRALLNDLFQRLERYCGLVGRRADLWHGDIGAAARNRIMSEPPDCLLITPESIEVILTSRRRDKARLFRNARVVVVDEIHAFAGDDRGWHLLSVLERVGGFAGRELQRIGLSATVGEPDRLLDWLAGPCKGSRQVIAPPTDGASGAEVTLDYVATLDNAAAVISRLHRGDKRLVFCDSRSQVEEIAAELNRLGVETYVSHSSIGKDARRQSEAAFSTGRNCVIVATSTLELGIDIGDLDHVIQIDAPGTVAAFLQRLGRTGRRSGSKRNCLFLATSDSSFLRAAGLLRLWGDGYVEPVSPPVSPFHLLAQQIMALALQEGGVGAQAWWSWIRRMPGFAAMDPSDVQTILRHMLDTEILFDDSGILWFGREGESSFGWRNFMELFSSFTSDPLISVRWGRKHLGEVDASTFSMRHEEVPVLLLAGRSWVTVKIDWDDRIAYVEPAEKKGKSRWLGSGQPLHYELCQAIRRVLTGTDPAGTLSQRALGLLSELREEFGWLDPDQTTVVNETRGFLTWWTFGGLCANAPLAARLREHRVVAGRTNNFSIRIDSGGNTKDIEEALRKLSTEDPNGMRTPIEAKTIHDLKFSVCLPEVHAVRMLQSRLTDPAAIGKVLAEPVKFVTGVVDT